MAFRSLVLANFLLVGVLFAETPEPQTRENDSGLSKEAALEHLLSERDSPKALDEAIAAARKAGVSEQAVLEARFLFHIDRSEDAEIAAMLPDFLKQRDVFRIEDSAIFAMKDDWLAVIEYVEAIVAVRKNDKEAFKKHITEAFWLSPRQAAAFVPQVERLRLEECMRSVKVDFSSKFKQVMQDDAVSLDALTKGKKALLLHFWSPMSRECEASMPDFAATALDLTKKGVAVVSIIPDDTPKLLENARALIRPLGEKAAGAWLVDSDEKSIGRELRVQDLPTMVLVSLEGSVLFNGPPSDDEFWRALSKIDAAITRPASPLENGR